jgi:hypothetical protein
MPKNGGWAGGVMGIGDANMLFLSPLIFPCPLP